MRVICPHCKTVYQLPAADPDAVLVCHRCGTEFGLGAKPEDAQAVEPTSLPDSQTPDMFAATGTAEQAANDAPDKSAFAGIPSEIAEETSLLVEDIDAVQQEPENDDLPEPGHYSTDAPAEDSFDPIITPSREEWPGAPIAEAANEPAPGIAQDIEEAESPDEIEQEPYPSGPPPRRNARIMPWLMTVVLLIAGTGFWFNHKAWLDDPWLRSVLINVGVHMEIRDKDWLVEPDSVAATWIERRGADTVLVINGEVVNQLQTDLLPPLIHITLFAQDNPDETILERDLIITRPPLMQSIRQAPYSAPPRDETPIAGLDRRGFLLVLEDLPQNAGNFSLTAKAR